MTETKVKTILENTVYLHNMLRFTFVSSREQLQSNIDSNQDFSEKKDKD